MVVGGGEVRIVLATFEEIEIPRITLKRQCPVDGEILSRYSMIFVRHSLSDLGTLDAFGDPWPS